MITMTPCRRPGNARPEATKSGPSAPAFKPAEPAGLAKIFTIFEGTSEIQRMLIGRAVTGLDIR
jgi:alkylation response protein AidB-like acyl-CoA dehydrogenase